MTEANLIWKFREAPQDGGEKGGDAAEHAFPSGLDTLVREIIQNSKDQDLNEGPVKIKFEFIDLAGPKRNLLEQALDWDYLHTHLEAVANLPYPGADRVRRELEELDQLPHLRILRISDYGTKGLIGPEISADAEGGDEGNFAPLLRNELTNSSIAKVNIAKIIPARCTEKYPIIPARMNPATPPNRGKIGKGIYKVPLLICNKIKPEK